MSSSFTSVGVLSNALPPGPVGAGAYALSFPLNVDLATGHWGIPQGLAGRNGQTIIAICLHTLETTLDTYKAYLISPIHIADVRPGEHGSLHYAVAADGTLHQFVLASNTAWAIQDLSNPTWTLLNAHVGVNVNYLTLNIGVEKYISPQMPTLMFRALADLVAYLCSLYELPVDADHIIDHSQLDDGFADCAEALATNLIATVISLVAQTAGQVSYDTGVLAAQLAALTTRVTMLETSFAASLATIATFANHVTTKAGASTLGHLLSSATLGVNATTGASSVTQNASSYKIISGTQALVANITAIVQFPVVASDVFSWVTPGVFQKVTPTVLGLYRVRVQIRFAASTWTAGRVIEVYLYKNGSVWETLTIQTIQSNLSGKVVEVQGECELNHSPVTDYYDVRIRMDDTNGAQTMESGWFLIERVGA